MGRRAASLAILQEAPGCTLSALELPSHLQILIRGAMMLAANLGFTALGIVILSTVTTTFLDAYSAGVTFTNIFSKLNEKKAALAMGVIGTLIAVVVSIEQYENFLYAIGSVFAPMFAILLTDYFIIRKNRRLQENLIINWGAFLVWVLPSRRACVGFQVDSNTLPMLENADALRRNQVSQRIEKARVAAHQKPLAKLRAA